MNLKMNLKYTNLALLTLRFGLAITFFRHGWEAIEHTPEMVPLVAGSGVSPFAPETLLTFIGILDWAIGALLALGIWTKKIAALSALWIFVVVLVLSKVNVAEDVFDHLPYLATALSMIVLGGGEWSVKKLFGRAII